MKPPIQKRLSRSVLGIPQKSRFTRTTVRLFLMVERPTVLLLISEDKLLQT
jgi:hypothetical protein